MNIERKQVFLWKPAFLFGARIFVWIGIYGIGGLVGWNFGLASGTS
ncbi:hypothetical protein QTN47_16440 [Danxiaibacter flavus]|uniref:Uncharacterized protein n=1 Tax=Danxiaibacter flavus TaxID=3049108 RepID=A0ABV3ZIX4_9BACT|nr:hypothetical protein QNM32_16450 [Chitinophagaceae bacterium DXS]